MRTFQITVVVSGLLLVCGISGRLGAGEIQLRVDARVTGEVVRLGEVAEIYSSDETQRDALASVELCAAPSLGTSKVIRLRTIQDLLQLRGLALGKHRFGGARKVTIHRPAPQRKDDRWDKKALAGRTAIVTREVEASLVRYLRAVAADESGWQAKVTLRPDQVKQLSSARGDLIVRGGAAPWARRQQFELLAADKRGTKPLTVLADVKLPSMVVAAARAIPRGVTIRESDLVLKRAERLVTRSTQYHSVEELIGMEVTRSVAEGQLLDTSYVRRPILVRQNDTVTVHALGTGVRVTTNARAKQSGSKGDRITLESLTDRSRFLGEIVSAGVVKIGVTATSARTRDNRLRR